MNTRVLIVDDEQAALTTFGLILGRDHEVDKALSADEAIERFEPGRYAVVISDLKMPGRNGIDLLEEVANQDPHCARILLTGYGNRESIIDAVNRAKIFMYLDKPCDPGTLQFAVRRAAERWILEREGDRLYSELERMEKPAAVGRVASSIGHDIRNYLVPLLVAAEESEPEEMPEALSM